MSRFRIEYLAYPRPRLDEHLITPLLEKREISVRWFWLAYLIIWCMKDSWEQGGRAVDTMSGVDVITWELEGVGFGDGKVHVRIARTAAASEEVWLGKNFVWQRRAKKAS